jgi:Na+-transporting NADH:ubiquinone oxidoreductase subunit A
MTRRYRIKSGLDIPVAGEAGRTVQSGRKVSHVALCGHDYPGLKPRLLVAKGDSVSLGQPLFIDKRDPAVNFASPGRGTVVAVNRGVRRVLETIVVRLHDTGGPDLRFEALSERKIQKLDRRQVADRLLRSGLWTAFRTRPFSKVPHSGSVPGSIFVTAIDTRPLAADPRVIVRRDEKAFETGLRVVTKLTEGPVFLCTAPGWDLGKPDIDRLQTVEFAGPHPAGLPGTHIHFLNPVGARYTVWHIGYQDVIAAGKLFSSGKIETERVVAFGGDPVLEPRLISTRLGAALEELTRDGIRDEDNCRVISGSVLCGRTAAGSLAFLGRYHNQVSVLREGGDRRLFGWLGLVSRRFSAASTILKASGHRRRHAFTTAQNGRYSGMMPMRVFERVMPLDILPSPLFRALLVKDTDQAQALGCLELDEEDLALCSFVCPAKNDYGAVLRINLDQIEREG